MNLSKASKAALVQYVRAAFEFGMNEQDQRDVYERVDREFARQANLEAEHLRNKAQNQSGSKRVLQDITVPVLYPQTKTAHAYLSSVFLSGYPIFATVTSPENQDAGDMMDAVNADHQVRAQWQRHLSLAMLDGLKYNICAVEVTWEQRNTFGLTRTQGGTFDPKKILWEGNVIKRLSPYNTFRDWRVPVADVHRTGEFAGYVEPISRIALKQLLMDLPEAGRLRNDKEALEAPEYDRWHFVPDVTDRVADQRTQPSSDNFNWVQWAAGAGQRRDKINYKNQYEKTVLYARILPEDFELDVPAKNTPQIWKFIFINGTVPIYAEKLTNAHNYLPIIFAQPEEDGLDEQTQSFSENLVEVQDMASALWNIRIATARRNVSDRLIYNPAFIRQEDINSSNPSAKIPVRPNQYLDDIRKAVFQFPFNPAAADSVIPDAQQVMEFGRSISGISRPFEGQFIKGNRTLGEYEDIRGNGDLRMQTMALFLEVQFFSCIKEVVKYNVLQYVKPGTVYFSRAQQKFDINPQIMQDAALDFRMSDGLLPSSKLADTEFLTMLLQLAMTNPEMQQRYDVPRLVSYLGSLRNIPDLGAFARGAGQQAQPASSAAAQTLRQVPASAAPPPQGAPGI